MRKLGVCVPLAGAVQPLAYGERAPRSAAARCRAARRAGGSLRRRAAARAGRSPARSRDVRLRFLTFADVTASRLSSRLPTLLRASAHDVPPRAMNSARLDTTFA